MIPLATVGRAALVGMIVALVVDIALQAALASVRTGFQPIALMGSALERLRWIVAASLFCLAAPWWDRHITHALGDTRRVPAAAAWSLAGGAMIVLPPIWIAATWLVMTTRMFMAGTWSTSSRIFLEPAFYSDLILGYAPWFLAGVTLLLLRRHVA